MVKTSYVTTVQEAKALFSDTLAAPNLSNPTIKACRLVLDTPDFWIAPGSAGNSPHAHHAYEGGLAIHTGQVMLGAVPFLESLGAVSNLEDLIVAVMWHDYGKIFDYDLIKGPYVVTRYGEKMNAYDKTPHYNRINHLSRSYAEFYKQCSPFLSPPRVEKISHIILAHHGRKEWGSPIEPNSPEAWAIHCADKMSSDYLP